MRRSFLLPLLMLPVLSVLPAAAHEEKLSGGEWVLAGDAGKPPPSIRFDAGRVSGTGGCNRFGGSYEMSGNGLSFSPLAATRMACAPDVMEREQAFFDLLAKVRRAEQEGDTLMLLDGEGNLLSRLARQIAE